MSSKLNINKIESYSQALGSKICNEIFLHKKALTGQDILKLTPIEQVNYFVLKNLFDKWTEEQNRLRSPYFNYDNEEVQKALQELANKLSNNIFVEKEFLKPLLTKAIAETLHWTLYPSHFMESQIQMGNFSNINQLRTSAKYFRFNKILIEKTIKKMEQENWKDLETANFMSLFEQILENTSHEIQDASLLIDQFANLLTFDLTEIVAAIHYQNNTEGENLKKNEFLEKPNPQNNESTKSDTNFVFEEADVIPVRTVLPPNDTVNTKPSNNPSIINDQFAKNNRTLNEMLVQHQNNATVNDVMARTKIHDLRSAISLNKRYQIINELFKGNTGEYLFAIEDIENSISHTDALQVLQEKFAHKYNWTFEDEVLKDFLQLIERRFM